MLRRLTLSHTISPLSFLPHLPLASLTAKFDAGKETYAPTPENLLTTKKPSKEKRSLKKILPEDGGKGELKIISFPSSPLASSHTSLFAPSSLTDLFDAGKETYAPTPENLLTTKKPSKEKRSLKKILPEDGGKGELEMISLFISSFLSCLPLFVLTPLSLSLLSSLLSRRHV